MTIQYIDRIIADMAGNKLKYANIDKKTTIKLWEQYCKEKWFNPEVGRILLDNEYLGVFFRLYVLLAIAHSYSEYVIIPLVRSMALALSGGGVTGSKSVPKPKWSAVIEEAMLNFKDHALISMKLHHNEPAGYVVTFIQKKAFASVMLYFIHLIRTPIELLLLKIITNIGLIALLSALITVYTVFD